MDKLRRVIGHNARTTEVRGTTSIAFRLPCLGRRDDYPCPPDSEERMWYLLHMESGAEGAIAVRSRGDWEGLGGTSPKNKGQVSALPRAGGESAGLIVRCGMVEAGRLGAGTRC